MRLRFFVTLLFAVVLTGPILVAAESVDDVEHYVPPMLFDIGMQLEETQLRSASELVAKVSLESYGTVPTPVSLVGRVYSASAPGGQALAERRGSTVVETNGVFTLRFPELRLPPGRYLLRVQTEYGIDMRLKHTREVSVTDNFESYFTVLDTRPWIVRKLDALWRVMRGEVSRIDPATQTAAIEMIGRRSESVLFDINHMIERAMKDAKVLSKTASALRLARGDVTARADLAQDFKAIIEERPVVYKIRYIDKSGREQVVVETDGLGHISIVPDKRLQDKSERYYFKEAMQIKPGEMYISKFDLNKENGKIEVRGTGYEPITIPTLRFATPVVTESGEKQGIIIINLYGEYLLREVRRYARPGERAVVIDHNGAYLAHPDKDKERYVNKTANFFKDYPELDKSAVLSGKLHRFVTKDKLFYFYKLQPVERQKDNYAIFIVISDITGTDDNLNTKLIGGLVILVLILLTAIFWLLRVK